MSEPTLTLMASGAYRLVDADDPPSFADRSLRWTAYAVWSEVDVDADDPSATVEEIDVDAADYAAAWRVAEQALARDFVPGGAIKAVEERSGLYI